MPENNPFGYLMQNTGQAQGNVSLFDSVAADLPEFQGFVQLQETFANFNKQLQDRQAQMQQQVQDRQQQIAEMLQAPEGTTVQQPTGGGRTQQPRPQQTANQLTSGTNQFTGGQPQPRPSNIPQQPQLPDLSSVLGGSRPVMQGTVGNMLQGGAPTSGVAQNIPQIQAGGGIPTSGVNRPVPQPQNTSEPTSRADRVNTQIPGINLLLQGGR